MSARNKANAPRLVLTVSLAIATAACSESGSDVERGDGLAAQHYEGPRPEGVSTPDEPVTTTYYVPQQAIGDMYEIEAGEIAMKRATSPEVRAFAQQMVEDHNATLAQLRNFVADNPINRALAQNLDPRRRAMIENLRSASDDDFEHVYLGQQAAAHDEAYNLNKSFAANGGYPELQAIAAENADRIAQHRQKIEGLLSKAANP